jgi:hypothetical protein
MMSRVDVKEIEATLIRYNCIAPFYDVPATLAELLYKYWRFTCCCMKMTQTTSGWLKRILTSTGDYDKTLQRM